MTGEAKSKLSNKHSKNQRQIIKRVIVIIIIVITSFGVYELGRHYHYWGESNNLRALKAEPIASKKLLNLELVHSEQKGQGDIGMIETPAPSVVREFRAQKDGVEATKRRIVEYAERDGWVYDPSIYSSDDSKWLWRKQGKGGSGLVLVLETTSSTVIILIEK